MPTLCYNLNRHKKKYNNVNKEKQKHIIKNEKQTYTINEHINTITNSEIFKKKMLSHILKVIPQMETVKVKVIQRQIKRIRKHVIKMTMSVPRIYTSRPSCIFREVDKE